MAISIQVPTSFSDRSVGLGRSPYLPDPGRPVKAELVKLRYCATLSVEETAEALGVSRATADRYWAYAKVWLYHAVTGGDEPALG
jgi:hypothetical protein